MIVNPIKQLGFLVYEYNIELCLKITHNVKNKPAKLALMLLASPYMLVSFAVAIVGKNRRRYNRAQGNFVE